MRRMGLGFAVAVSTVVLATGCASGGTAFTPGPAAATPTPVLSPGSSPSPMTSANAPTLPNGYDASRNAKADIRAALASAAREHREVLIDFGANWCPDCRALDAMFRSAQVEPLLQKDYVVVAVDVGQFNRNLNVAGQYVNLQTSGIPALVILKPDGALRTATNDGSFSNARNMDPSQVRAFLTRWAPGGSQ